MNMIFQTDRQTDRQTGYPSIDKPWNRFYAKEIPELPSPDRSIYAFLFENNKDRLGYTALDYFGTKVTFKQLFERIDRVSAALRAYGVGKGDIVTLCPLNTPEFVYLIYALSKIGAVSNIVGLNSPKSDLHEQISKAGSKLVFAIDLACDIISKASEQTEVSKIICVPLDYSMPVFMRALYRLKNRKGHGDCIRWDAFIRSNRSDNEPANPVNGVDLAVIEYTGGSTGIPKGVMLSNRALNSHYINFFHTNQSGIFSFSNGDKIISGVPFFLTFGLCASCLSPLCHAMTLVLAPNPSAEAGIRLIMGTKVNHVLGGRLLIEALLQKTRESHADLSYVKSVMYGGEETNKTWEKSIVDGLKPYGMNAPLLNSYGMSETSAGILTAPDNDTDGLIPCANVNVKIVNPDDSSIEYSYNNEGELCVATDQLMSGYYENDSETNDVFFEENGVRWLRTHDLATISESGVIRITGRIKRIYSRTDANKIQIRVYPMRIEETIIKDESVQSCAVVGIKDDVTAYRSIAYIILNNETESTETARKRIDDLCRKNLPESHIPDEYRFLTGFPHTRAGKVDYRALEDMAKKANDT